VLLAVDQHPFLGEQAWGSGDRETVTAEEDEDEG
jgi:hypothetical protein